jgi:hypothetical protein
MHRDPQPWAIGSPAAPAALVQSHTSVFERVNDSPLESGGYDACDRELCGVPSRAINSSRLQRFFCPSI